MNLESQKQIVEQTPEVLFKFLTQIENYKQLMPDNISKFEVLGEKRFIFALKGMPEIVLDLKEQIPFNKVVLGAASDKLPFTLTSNILELTEGNSEVRLHFEGEFNAMMAMMIKSPIQKFIETLARNMQHIQ